MSKKSQERWLKLRSGEMMYAGQTNCEAALAIKKAAGLDVVLTHRPTGFMAIMTTKDMYDDVSEAIAMANAKEMSWIDAR